MDRKEVLEKHITSIIANYSKDQREEEIEQLLLENWSNVDGWTHLSKGIQQEFINEKLTSHYGDKKYDEVLRFKLRDDFKGVTNEYLSSKTGIKITPGSAVDLIACPCCGYKTLENRNAFEICTICWWEDDGQDNKHADEIWGGPNYGVSLTQARHFYLTIGIYNPKQIHLKEIQEEAEKYSVGRVFEIDGAYVVEKAENWKGKIKAKT
ncbi:MAG: CPCC family cysteine-rich protein [Bacteroidota bacterium]